MHGHWHSFPHGRRPRFPPQAGPPPTVRGRRGQPFLHELGVHEGLVRPFGIQRLTANADDRVVGCYGVAAAAHRQFVGAEADEHAVLPVDGMIGDDAETGGPRGAGHRLREGVQVGSFP